MIKTIEDISQLYDDSQACAKLIGLKYIDGDEPGITRLKRGQGFSYKLEDGRLLGDKQARNRIAQLVIPPAWQEVWICADDRGHILATGIDDRGRKQYIYHPRWRTLRDLLKFYRLINFGKALPTIRRKINENLDRPQLDREKVLGVMLWLLDNTYLRVGNDEYFAANDSIGLTTLLDKNLVVAGPVITMSFNGKSGKPQQITFDNSKVADIIQKLIDQRGARLFRYRENGSFVNIDADMLNAYLHEIAGGGISAKDFRTWGGTLMAFNHLVELEKLPDSDTPKPDKAVIQAVDSAADVLGNTRAVAKSSYIHPDILETYGTKNFDRYYEFVQSQPRVRGLDEKESDLVHFLEKLFDEEFELIKQT